MIEFFIVIKNIREFEGTKNILIILFRSKSWPYAKAHSKKLRNDYEKFQDYDTILYAILPDNLENAKNFESEFAKVYPIYYDSKKKVNKMLKQEVKPLKLGRMPALLIINKRGIIKYAHYSDSMDDIPKNEELFEVLKKINNSTWFGGIKYKKSLNFILKS